MSSVLTESTTQISQRTTVLARRSSTPFFAAVYAAMCLFLLGFAPLSNADVVNINKADATALEQHLKGIGPVKAKAIVDYRRKNGPFKKIEDLRNVEGIGDKIFGDNKPNLSLNRGATRASASSSDKSSPKTAASNKKRQNRGNKENNQDNSEISKECRFEN